MQKLHAVLAIVAAVGFTACSSDSAGPLATSPDRSGPSLALAAGNNAVVVTEEDIARQINGTPPTRNWVLYTIAVGNGVFRTGPADQPLGVGSLELTTPTVADKATLFNFDHVGTALADVDAMKYFTFRSAGSGQPVASLNIAVDINGAGPGGFTTLVFEPVYNTAQGPVVSGEWQDWDAYRGGQAIWWSTRDIPGAAAAASYVTWASIVTANPNAVILGGFGINQGRGNGALTTSVDALTLGYGGDSVTYDFEPYRVATSADACKNGGWKTLKRADGTAFKNQGDCVSYVSNGR